MTTIHFSQQHITQIYLALENNHGSLIKAFDVVWEGGCYGDSPRSHAPIVLRLIERVSAFILTEGRDPERVWKAFNSKFPLSAKCKI